MDANQLQSFRFKHAHPFRAVTINGHPWFVSADVCGALGIGNTSMALERLDEDERGISSIPTPGGLQEMLIINESGLYSLILGSRKPSAKKFKKWVTSEVLPAISKTGGYAPTSFAETLQLAADQQREIERQQDQIKLAATLGAGADAAALHFLWR